MATNVTVTAEYRIDDYFDKRQSGGDIYVYTSGGGAYFDPSLYVALAGAQTITGAKTFSALGTFSAGINVTGAITGTGEVESYDTSDIRLKEDIEDLDRKRTFLDVMKLRAIRYFHKLKKKTEIGLIAQEVKKYFPEAVKENDEGYLMIHYATLVPVLLATIQEQQRQIDELKEIVTNGTRGE
jgi:hypothetical protein